MEMKYFIRLCHVCSHLNEAEEEVLRCQSCAKGFLPMNYFEKIQKLQMVTKDKKKMESMSEETFRRLAKMGVNPLPGLIVFW